MIMKKFLNYPNTSPDILLNDFSRDGAALCDMPLTMRYTRVFSRSVYDIKHLRCVL